MIQLVQPVRVNLLDATAIVAKVPVYQPIPTGASDEEVEAAKATYLNRKLSDRLIGIKNYIDKHGAYSEAFKQLYFSNAIKSIQTSCYELEVIEVVLRR
jgi:hypothetical protein